jgi:hypothetical protein
MNEELYSVIHKSLRICELDCATTKTDTTERSISIGRESLQVFIVLGALAYFQVPPLGGSRDEKRRSQWIRKRSVSWNLPNLSQLWLCNGGFGSCTTQNHLQTKQFVNGTWIPAEWLSVRCETNRPSGPMGPDTQVTVIRRANSDHLQGCYPTYHEDKTCGTLWQNIVIGPKYEEW